jgi:large subunit ribosomal protein L6
MSRIGRRIIALPSGVDLTVDAGTVRVKGPKGELTGALPAHTSLQIDGRSVLVERDSDLRQARANHGLARALVNNMVVGVSKGFEKQLEVIGVGYRAEVKGNALVLNLGYSHPIEFAVPAGISIAVDKANKITVAGIDRQQVGQVSAVIRSFRKPDHYKGKGVRYVNEYVRIKAGKSA